jgi:hypothetical protein
MVRTFHKYGHKKDYARTMEAKAVNRATSNLDKNNRDDDKSLREGYVKSEEL